MLLKAYMYAAEGNYSDYETPATKVVQSAVVKKRWQNQSAMQLNHFRLNAHPSVQQ